MIVAQEKTAPQQYKQPSRKGKKAWRKNVDVSDVQTGLDHAREEIIQGGIIAEKPSKDLFILDTAGSEPVQKAYNKIHKPSKTDQILAQRSAIPAIDSRKRSKVTDGVLEPSSKRRKSNGVNYKEYKRLHNLAYRNEPLLEDAINGAGSAAYDPWASESTGERQDGQFNFLKKEKPIRAPKTLKEAPTSLVEGAVEFPAVPQPKAGASYNPMFEDYDRELVEEGAREVVAERQRLREAEMEQQRLDRIRQAQEERDDIQTEDESAWEGIESEYEGEEWLRKRRPERKTPAERNKIKRRKEAERQAKLDALMKKRAQQAQRINEIIREVKEKENNRAVTLASAEKPIQELASNAALRRRKFGNSSIPQAPLELVLPDELQDSLRLLKPEGNLLKDRYRNILIRGKIETRRPIHQHKKPKRSITEKWSYKDWSKGFMVAS